MTFQGKRNEKILLSINVNVNIRWLTQLFLSLLMKCSLSAAKIVFQKSGCLDKVMFILDSQIVPTVDLWH